MNLRPAISGGFRKALAIAIFVAVVIGLPVAVELNEPANGFLQAAVHARSGDAVEITAPVSLSRHVALTLHGGLVSPAGQGEASPRSPGRIVVDEAQLTLDLSRGGGAAAATAPADAEEAPLAVIAGFSTGAMQMRRGTLQLITAAGSPYLVKDVSATVSSTRKGSFKLVGTGQFRGQRLSLEAAWSEGGPRDGIMQLPLRLALRSSHLEASFDGLLAPAAKAGKPVLTGTAEFNVSNLRRLLSWLGLGTGLGDYPRAIAVSGPVEWSTAQLAFARTTVDVDGNQATGTLTVKHVGNRPAVDATLAFSELDVGRMLFAGNGGQRERPGESKGAAGRMLAKFDADLRLSAAKLVAPAVELGRGAMTIALNNGRLEADLVDLQIEGGLAEGRITLDMTQPTPRANVKLKARGVDTGRLAAAPLRRNALLGRANVTFKGEAEGASLSEALARLTGRGQLELAEPGRLGLDLTALAYAARATPVVGWAAAGKGSTALDKFTCRFRVLYGALTVEALQARSGASSYVGSGRIDVPGRLMDVKIASGPAAQGEAPVTAQSVLSLRGTWDDPAISLVKQEPPAPGGKDETGPRSH